jgi:hypothetical protein
MKIFFKNSLFLCLLACMWFSCKVEKRIYRKGYHVVWDHHKTDRKNITEHTKSIAVTPPKEKAPERVIVSIDQPVKEKFISGPLKSTLVLGKDTCGDVIYMKNGEKISVKVLEVDRGLIKYKRCDNLDGPLFSVRKSSIAMLQYYNGVKEDLEFEAGVQDYTQSKPVEQKKQNGMGLAAFICSVAGLFLVFAFPLAMVFGIISMQQFKREPNKYSDKWMPRAALIISAVVYLLVALIAGLTAVFSFEMWVGIAAIIALALGIICIIPLTNG